MMNETVGERIRIRRKELRMSVDTLAEKIGKNRATVYRYERGEIENVSIVTLQPLAKALKTTPAYLMGWEANPSSNQNIQQHPDIIPIKTKKIPLLGDIACGEPIMCNQEYDLYIDVAADLNVDFCVRAKGDSMINARIFNGDIVFCRNQPNVENGEIAVVIIDNEATLKRVYKYPNRIELRPENPTMRPIEYEGSELENIRILGKAIAFQSMVI